MSKTKKVCGKIVEVKGNNIVVVNVVQSAGCSHCESKDACAVASGKSFQVEVVTDKNVKVGDMVELSMLKKDLYRNGFVVYILPLIFLILGAVIGTEIDKNFGTEYVTPLFSLFLLILYFVGLRYFMRNKKENYIIENVL